jgi:hypothetical protein
MGYSETSKAYHIWDKQSRRIIENKDVLFDELGMEGGDICETILNDTIMHLSGIALDAPVPKAQHLMVREGAHKVRDAQLLVKATGVMVESPEQFIPLDTTNSRDSLDDILPMMNNNHAFDQVDTIIEVDSMIDDDLIVDATMQTMQINTQGDV